MKSVFVFLFLLLFGIANNTNAQVKKVFYSKLQEQNGIYLYKNTPFTGISIATFENKRKWQDRETPC